MTSHTYTITRDQIYNACCNSDKVDYYELEGILESCLPTEIQEVFGSWNPNFEVNLTINFDDDNSLLHTIIK